MYEYTIDEKIGNQIRRYRCAGGLSQGQLADKLNVSLTTINRLENGRQMVSVTKLVKIAEVLQIDAGSLLCDFDFSNSVRKNDIDSQIESALGKYTLREKNIIAEALKLYIKRR